MPEFRIPLSVLDLAPVGSGSSGPEALRNSLELARQAVEAENEAGTGAAD